MRQIDNMTPEELETLSVKGMLGRDYTPAPDEARQAWENDADAANNQAETRGEE